MIYKNYPEILAAEDIYKTPNDAKGSFIIKTEFNFYFNLIRTVISANILTKRKKYDRYNWAASSLEIMKYLEKVGVKFFIEGMNNITKYEGPVIFISNHMSTLETLILPGIINPVKLVCFITKKELNDYPLFGPITKARHPIVVGRNNPREDLKTVMEEGKKRLDSGRSIIIFPQKTRGLYFEEKTFNSLGIKIAKRNNVPIVPLTLLTDAWGNGKRIKDFGRIDPSKLVRIKFGEPFFISGGSNDAHMKVVDFIKANLIDWGRGELIKN